MLRLQMSGRLRLLLCYHQTFTAGCLGQVFAFFRSLRCLVYPFFQQAQWFSQGFRLEQDRHTDCLRSTWGFRCQQSRLLKRLDKFDVRDWAQQHGGFVCISPRTVLPYHAPISLSIQFEPFTTPRGCQIPHSLLSCDALIEKVQQIWSIAACQVPSPDDFLTSCASASSTTCSYC